MTSSEDFVVWMHGVSAMVGPAPTAEQWALIREELEKTLGKMAERKLIGSFPEKPAGARSAGLYPGMAIGQASDNGRITF